MQWQLQSSQDGVIRHNIVQNIDNTKDIEYTGINELIKDIKRDPFEGIGKPEALKYDLFGKWSRRITDEHRLVYQMEGNNLIVFTCRYHY